MFTTEFIVIEKFDKLNISFLIGSLNIFLGKAKSLQNVFICAHSTMNDNDEDDKSSHTIVYVNSFWIIFHNLINIERKKKHFFRLC